MATAAVQSNQGHGPAFQQAINTEQKSTLKSGPTPHNVETTLYYYEDNGEPPVPRYVGQSITEGERPPQAVKVTVNDIAGNESKYTLDGNGFQIHSHKSIEKDFRDDDKIKRDYYPETEQLLKDVTGATRVFIFDHTIRRKADPTVAAGDERGPVQRVHIDQSYTASRSRVPYHLPDEADELLKGRVQIINVWRPIKQIFKDPLAVADAHSVPDSDLVGVPLIYPTRNGETYAVKHNPSHRWYFKYGLSPEEVTLIKCYDSKEDGRARRVPHSAFVDDSEEHRESRESIEVRALVFHENDRE